MVRICDDILYESDNEFDIPCLRLDRQGGKLRLPFVPYGTGRPVKAAMTIHFYVDDYRFSAFWKNPAKILNTTAVAIVEPNFSLFDTTPLAEGLSLIYRKRWIARFLQENGIGVYADLNVGSKFREVNMSGIPEGYNAFATRGSRGRLEALSAELGVAREISGLDHPNLIVYGGGREIHNYCMENSLLYIHDYMTERRIENG